MQSRLSRILWHTAAAALLATLATFSPGCNSGTSAAAPSQQTVPVPKASMDKSDQLPPAVRDSFFKDREGSTVLRVKHRMQPDGMVHYTISSIDAQQQTHSDEYRSDGMRIGPPVERR